MGLLRTRGRIRREAADWAAHLGAGADGAEHEAFRAWYLADPRHAEAYDRIAAIWSAAGRISPSPAPAPPEGLPVQPPRSALRYAIAASLVAGVALVLAVLLASRWLPQATNGQALSFATAADQIRQVVLPDGSRLVLDVGTRVDALFGSNERRLTLRQGRARFAVAHETRLFIVSAGSNEVVATGTLFDVSLTVNRLAVVLIEGSVVVRPTVGGHDVGARRLRAGQKLVVANQAIPVTTQASREETLWANRMLQFDETPLREATALVNRYSRVHLLLADDRIASLRVTGAFRTGDTEAFARSLAIAFNLRLEPLPDGSLRLTEPRSATGL
jgi:transmembrane sensor